MIGFAAIIKATAQLTWPLMVGLLGWIFRDALSSFLASFKDRDLSLKTPAFEATVGAKVQQQVDRPAEEKLSLENVKIDLYPRNALNIMHSRIQNEVAALPKETREAALMTALAQARLGRGHEGTYNRIFGSQIAALKRINEIGHADSKLMHDFFEPYARLYPLLYDNYSFHDWLNFMVHGELLSQTDGQFQITEFGRDFLVYLTETRLTEAKLY